MSIDPALAALYAENNGLLHAIQTGIEYTMPEAHREDPSCETSPKHLRVGVNNALCIHAGLVKLLVDKGVITEVEYFTAANAVLAEDVASYERKINDRFGPDSPTKVTLG